MAMSMRWVIGCGGGIIARHPRSLRAGMIDMVFDPIHYLPLLEQKIAALDQAAPLAGWELPDALPDPAPSAGGAHGQVRQAGNTSRSCGFWRPSISKRFTAR